MCVSVCLDSTTDNVHMVIRATWLYHSLLCAWHVPYYLVPKHGRAECGTVCVTSFVCHSHQMYTKLWLVWTIMLLLCRCAVLLPSAIQWRRKVSAATARLTRWSASYGQRHWHWVFGVPWIWWVIGHGSRVRVAGRERERKENIVLPFCFDMRVFQYEIMMIK